MRTHCGNIDLQGGREGGLVSGDEQRSAPSAGTSGRDLDPGSGDVQGSQTQAGALGLPELTAHIAELEWEREKLPGANEQDVPT